MKVGYSTNNYPAKKNIIDKSQGVDYVRVLDVYRILYILAKINQKLLHLPIFDINALYFSFNDFNLNRVDLLHLFNAVSFERRPWITTFETIIPRFKSTLSCHHGKNYSYAPLRHDKKVLKVLEMLCNDPCKKLIAMSECSLNMQRDFLLNFPEYYSEIEPKLTYLHTPQQAIVKNYEAKQLSLDGQLHFMFVAGNNFFRKGGWEILKTFQEARKKNGYRLKLSIISSVMTGDCATKEKTGEEIDGSEEEVVKAKDILHKNSDWIAYYSYLPNHKIIELMRSAHIGLLPTYADTYGFSVLEFQASGCPVISTNVRALPEINNNEIGWLIEVPKNRLGEAIYTTEEDRFEIRQAIKKGLMISIVEVMENREVILQKANTAVRHIEEFHSLEEFSRRLSEFIIVLYNKVQIPGPMKPELKNITYIILTLKADNL